MLGIDFVHLNAREIPTQPQQAVLILRNLCFAAVSDYFNVRWIKKVDLNVGTPLKLSCFSCNSRGSSRCPVAVNESIDNSKPKRCLPVKPYRHALNGLFLPSDVSFKLPQNEQQGTHFINCESNWAQIDNILHLNLPECRIIRLVVKVTPGDDPISVNFSLKYSNFVTKELLELFLLPSVNKINKLN